MAGMRWASWLLRTSQAVARHEKALLSQCRSFLPASSTGVKSCLSPSIHTPVSAVFSRSTHSATETPVDLHANHISLHTDGPMLNIPYVWLRDHCRCNNCYNHDTFQKKSDSYTVTYDMVPKKVEMPDSSTIRLTWQDGHKTEFSVAWLQENFYTTVARQRLPKFLWDKALMRSEPLPAVAFDLHLGSEEGLRATLFNLLKYGFCLVTGTPTSVEATQQVAERICFILETTFGRMWTFTSDNQRADTAYTNIHLQPHNDCTYLTAPAGMQIFHCLNHEGSGGQTLLVDGYFAAQTLCSEDPDSYNFLTKAIVPQEYRDSNCHYYSRGSVINVVPGTGEMIRVRFNPYDMAPLDSIPPAEIPRFYQAYDKLTKLMWDRQNIFPIKLLPGLVLLVDNWRVLHGRAAFTGTRTMAGCYLPRNDWISKAKILGLD